jgi:hypothetical protein
MNSKQKWCLNRNTDFSQYDEGRFRGIGPVYQDGLEFEDDLCFSELMMIDGVIKR